MTRFANLTTTESIQSAIESKQEAVRYLCAVTNRHRTHTGKVKWTEGGLRLYRQLTADILELRKQMAVVGGVQT